MVPSRHVPLGRVIKTHGLKGEVSVAPATGLPFVLPEGLEVWFVPPPSTVRTGRVQSIRPGPKGPLVKISGVDDVDSAAGLCGTQMLALAADLPASWFEDVAEELDVVGMSVTDVDRGLLGEIVEVIVTGANDVWVVDGRFGEVLLPVIDDVVVSVDEEGRAVVVWLLPGLLADEGEDA